jgi:hydroxymethylpyrimidine/phosphomethylpyrimidine kinase
MKRVLTIAGSDSGGGAGIQADLKTFHQHGCFGMTAITAITVQNTLGVHGVAELAPDIVSGQIDAVVKDIGIDAVKLGMLSSAGIIQCVSVKIKELELPNLVVDPVMRAKGGDPLLRYDAQQALIEQIIPLADLVTPNIPEAEVLAGMIIKSVDDMRSAARIIHERGARNVLIKGGHRKEDANDMLFDGADFCEFKAARIKSKNTHGTGCTYSAAIASNLALGYALQEAIGRAKEFINRAIRQSLNLGGGIGPLNHFVDI